MRKLVSILTFFLVLCLIFIFICKDDNESKLVMYEPKSKNNYYYRLDFNNEVLTFRNFKLKLGLFTSYNYYIKKVYVKYPKYIKDKFIDKKYFSFDNSNFNDGIEKIKKEYIILLREKYLYEELEKDMDDVVLERVDLYCELDALTKFKRKFPNVIVSELQ